jgi:endonuclease-8
MPEGPEVRKYADSLDAVLRDRTLKVFTARTVNAKAWLKENGSRLEGLRVTSVFSRGKHLVGLIENDFYFHAHLMMWGRWQTFVPEPPHEIDRRERARVVAHGGAAILYSAPIFNVGEGDPFKQIEHLGSLGPDVLPYDKRFDEKEFLGRLLNRKYRRTSVGAALLNQEIVAGLGNYLRAEILFACKIDPWKTVNQLDQRELDCLVRTIPRLSRRSYASGATARPSDRERMKADPSLVYQVGREYGTRHMVFRRTNLPCLRCGEIVRQQRQVTYSTGDEERDRIVYFCRNCQKVNLPEKRSRRK